VRPEWHKREQQKVLSGLGVCPGWLDTRFPNLTGRQGNPGLLKKDTADDALLDAIS
jgi:hypothetical protein